MKLSVFLGIILFTSQLNANAYVDSYTKKQSREVQSVIQNVSDPNELNKSSTRAKNLNFSLKEKANPYVEQKGTSNYDNFNKSNFNDYDFNNYGR